MTNTQRISKIRLGAASAALTLLVVLGFGVVTTPLAQARTYKVLYTFTGGTDGALPYAGLIRDSQGNLYGTTENGGNSACQGGCGVVFKVDTSGNETVLYSFTGGADGWAPLAGLIRDAQGNLYGTTFAGGHISGCGGSGCGVVFKLDTAGQETALYSFKGGADGATPYAGLIRDAQGNLYGTAGGGHSGNGVVFKVSQAGKETVLYSFCPEGRPCKDGAVPLAGLIWDSKGNLYGTTQVGGKSRDGVVFELSPARKETVLHSFTGGNDGVYPEAGVIRDTQGNLYGTTWAGGAHDGGTVFELSPTGKETVLYSFTGAADGRLPTAGVIRDAQGNLYGTTSRAGNVSDCGSGCGVVFEVSP